MDGFVLFHLPVLSPLDLWLDACLPFSKFYELILIGHLVYSTPCTMGFRHILLYPHNHLEELFEFRKGDKLLRS